MSALDELLNEIFDGRKPLFYSDFETWVRGSRRFKAFATSYRGKIRSKLKNIRDEGGMKDLRAELETAAILLREEGFTLEYEKYAASKQRGPDFTVTFKTHTPFNVEVRRIRSMELDDADAEATITKLVAVLCDKAGQMPPSIINLLWLITPRDVAESDLNQAVIILRQLAERKAEDFFTRRGFQNATDFLKHFGQLSGIVLRQPGGNILWLNPIARHKAPPELIASIRRMDTL